MRTLQRAAAALIYPAILCTGVACERADPPTKAPPRPGAMLLSSGAPASGFLLGGTAQLAQDPENPANDVIVIRTDVSPFYGTVSRTLNVQIALLDNMLEFKSFFQNRSCGGGSPRVQLAIDLNGDGVPDGNAFGYTGPPFAGCPPNNWQYDDVTDALPRWDLSQFVVNGFPPTGAICSTPPFSTDPAICPFQTHSGYIPWNVFKTVLSTLFPLHKVCSGALIDDSGWFPPADGTAFYDLFSAGRATWEDQFDIAGRGFAMGCGRPDDGDREVDGDKDHDHDHDADDDKFDSDRRERWKN